MGDTIRKAINLIKEGRWFEGVILISMIVGLFYFFYWWTEGKWESKGKCATCKGVGTLLSRGQIEICPRCKGTGKPKRPN